jgi:hypothetical protein
MPRHKLLTGTSEICCVQGMLLGGTGLSLKPFSQTGQQDSDYHITLPVSLSILYCCVWRKTTVTRIASGTLKQHQQPATNIKISNNSHYKSIIRASATTLDINFFWH